jgi:hypothetical protein
MKLDQRPVPVFAYVIVHRRDRAGLEGQTLIEEHVVIEGDEEHSPGKRGIDEAVEVVWLRRLVVAHLSKKLVEVERDLDVPEARVRIGRLTKPFAEEAFDGDRARFDNDTNVCGGCLS